MPISTDTGTSQRPVESVTPTGDSPPADLYRRPYESPPVYGLEVEMGRCNLVNQFAPIKQAEEMVPLEVIAQVICGIQAELRSDQENYANNVDELYGLFYENLAPYLDMRFAGGAVLGKHWRAATADQRDRFVSAFQTIFIQRWAKDLWECYRDDLTILPYTGDAQKRTTQVKTTCQLLDGTSVPVGYTLVNREEQWRIFDLMIEGISYIINYRKELDIEIRNSGLEAVIRRLEKEARNDANDG